MQLNDEGKGCNQKILKRGSAMFWGAVPKTPATSTGMPGADSGEAMKGMVFFVVAQPQLLPWGMRAKQNIFVCHAVAHTCRGLPTPDLASCMNGPRASDGFEPRICAPLPHHLRAKPV